MKTLFRTIALAAIASLAFTGCIKHEPYGRPGHGGQGGHGGEETVTPRANERDDWSFSYKGREDYVNPKTGGVEEVERFHFEYKGKGRFIFRAIRQEDFKNNYNNNEVAFFKQETESLSADDERFGAETNDVLFDRMQSGSWIGFMIEAILDNKGNVASYDYCEQTYTIKEEDALEEYNKWLGDWRVLSGTAGFDIRISHLDNNFLYMVDGWESGDAVSFKMSWLDDAVYKQYLIGEFWKPDGCLYIQSQYLGSYTDNDFGYGEVDEVFLGNIFDSNGRTIIEDEGLDVAQMIMLEKNAAELRAMPLRLETNNGFFDTEFYSMQYFMWDHKEQKYHPYNDNAGDIKFPFTMTRLPGTRAESFAPAKARVTTKDAIHRYQPKVARGSRNSVAKKAVRVK